MKLLWLTSWYPNKTEPFAGDFIQRHAQAVSLYHDVHVIHVVRDAKGTVTKSVRVEEHRQGRLHEQIVYYYTPFQSSYLGKFLSQVKYNRVFAKAIDRYIKANGKPHGVHVHVGMKAGLMAMQLLKKYALPYVVTEHWTGFLPEAKHRINHQPAYIQSAWRMLFKKAAGVSAVSAHLASQLRGYSDKTVAVIPNVVNTDIFTPAAKTESPVTRFVHISGMDHQKNPEAILKALAMVQERGLSFRVDMFGPQRAEVQSLADVLKLDRVHFHGEVPQRHLLPYLQQSDALLLYSRYETFGCVVIEAMATGVPVIASDIPAMRELIMEGRNGFLVKPDDPAALAEAIASFIQQRPAIDAVRVAAECTVRYGYDAVGRQFSNWYKTIFSQPS